MSTRYEAKHAHISDGFLLHTRIGVCYTQVAGVAYVRFASVYRQFKDIGTFMDELNKLLDGK